MQKPPIYIVHGGFSARLQSAAGFVEHIFYILHWQS